MPRNDIPRGKKLAGIFIKARKAKGFSQEELAQKVNVSTETIRKFEQKKVCSPGVFLTIDLAHALDLKIQDVLIPRSPKS